MTHINLNGKLLPTNTAAMAVDNGAFRYGYGLFETMLVQGGAIMLAHYHWARLFAGLQQLGLEAPALMTATWLEEQVLRTVSRNKAEALCRVRLQLYAGGGGLYGADVRHPQFVIECFPLQPELPLLNENGLVLGIAQGISKSADALSNLKSCNALIYAMGARQAKTNKWNDALITNTQGNIIESTIANIFWIKNGHIYTPPLSEGCVAGVMRAHLLANVAGITEKPLSSAELMAADEVFLTNAVRKIKWVSHISDATYTCKAIAGICAAL